MEGQLDEHLRATQLGMRRARIRHSVPSSQAGLFPRFCCWLPSNFLFLQLSQLFLIHFCHEREGLIIIGINDKVKKENNQ